MKKYYIAERNDKQFNAANKAREDVERCFIENKYIKYNVFINLLNSKFPKFSLIKELIIGLLKFNSNDSIYFQYPYYKNNKKIKFIINKYKKYKNIKAFCIIHDLDTLRYKKNEEEVKNEINFLNLCDSIISHNKSMTKWLRKNGCKTNIIDLEVFDYILDEDLENKENKRNTDIVFAGNLDKNKSGFIYKLINKNEVDFSINLYGPNFSESVNSEKIKYNGKFPPDELIKKVEGKFGLIWDGEELDCCSGEMGEYTKYNNPHKLSMYIAAGLPIVCWSKMAIADFVEENGIGISIDNLNELKDVISNINDEQYNNMLNKLKRIRDRVISGYYINKSLISTNNILTSKE